MDGFYEKAEFNRPQGMCLVGNLSTLPTLRITRSCHRSEDQEGDYRRGNGRKPTATMHGPARPPA